MNPNGRVAIQSILDGFGNKCAETAGRGQRDCGLRDLWRRTHRFKRENSRRNDERLTGRAPKITVAGNWFAADERQNLVIIMRVVAFQGLEIRVIQQMKHKKIIALADDLVGN